ncbi:unnamed protein product [Rhizoctonia solani]|uniref:Uncharacterized protein n=1 Tax=Rhizoctonia solani TaxID=456999 RepID=A0A8H3E224_9AGAM|nr:unnamed protein product [Rhizoctonia solani]
MSNNAGPMPFHGPWEGDTRIVLGIDIGTTQSSVAFSFLQNGMHQTLHRVTKWPGQEAHNKLGIIPTLVWYDTNRRAVSFGAEAQLDTTQEEAEDNGWVLAKHFKLHLHPSDMRARHELKLDPLPFGVILRQVYSDFLGYLLKHTRSYFGDHIIDGQTIWERYSPTMELVIAHPNGWNAQEQSFLRSAAVSAGFATSEETLSKVRFVTEAEASVHFCIHHTNLGTVLQASDPESGLLLPLTSAIGSSLGLISWCATLVALLLTLLCTQLLRHDLFLSSKRNGHRHAGATFVDVEAEKFLRRTLAGAGLNPDDVAKYAKTGAQDFQSSAKRMFVDETLNHSIVIAHTGFNKPSIGVRRGRMTISG